MNLGRKYSIMNWSDLTDAIADSLDITPKTELRRSVSGVDRVVVSWTGSTPAGLSGYTAYSHSQIKTILEGDDWDNYQDPETATE